MQLGRLLSFWPWRKDQRNYDLPHRHIESEFIGRLPPEIWLLIYDNLNLEDGGSLALSNMAMRCLLRTRNLNRLAKSHDRYAKARFLLHSDVHMPHHRLCFVCMAYHERRNFCQLESDPARIPYAHLSFCATIPFSFVQLAKRSYCHKSTAYGISLSKFESLCLGSHPQRYDTFWKRSYHAAITDQDPPHLLLRAQSELLYDLSCAKYDPELYKVVHRMDPPGCRHGAIPFFGSSSMQIADIWQSRFTSDNPSVIKSRCVHCPTEYLIEADTIRVKVTIWTDFGDGMSPWDGTWARLTYKPPILVANMFKKMPGDNLSIEQRFNAAFDQRRNWIFDTALDSATAPQQPGL